MTEKVESENETRGEFGRIKEVMNGNMSYKINKGRCSFLREILSQVPEIMSPKTNENAGLLCLMLLLPAHITALDCNFLQLEQERFNLQSLNLLKEQSTKVPQECLENMTTFTFSTQILKIHQPELAAKAVHEMLQGFFGIFSSDLLKTDWEPTFRQRFLNMLYAQTERIKRCLAGKKRRSQEEWKIKLRLKKYFQRMRHFLKEKGKDSCAWQSVKLEFRTSFIYIDILTKRMRI
ncbi:interferon beta-like [Sceloporus undulatus]|uniref:interferon beta-like n=1 Tax=Sceloporus undulatus TaxID=8520 RepID=UPI001C4CA00D|nr:interferon beta-like [Sceloporus undulatus]